MTNLCVCTDTAIFVIYFSLNKLNGTQIGLYTDDNWEFEQCKQSPLLLTLPVLVYQVLRWSVGRTDWSIIYCYILYCPCRNQENREGDEDSTRNAKITKGYKHCCIPSEV